MPAATQKSEARPNWAAPAAAAVQPCTMTDVKRGACLHNSRPLCRTRSAGRRGTSGRTRPAGRHTDPALSGSLHQHLRQLSVPRTMLVAVQSSTTCAGCSDRAADASLDKGTSLQPASDSAQSDMLSSLACQDLHPAVQCRAAKPHRQWCSRQGWWSRSCPRLLGCRCRAAQVLKVSSRHAQRQDLQAALHKRAGQTHSRRSCEASTCLQHSLLLLLVCCSKRCQRLA